MAKYNQQIVDECESWIAQHGLMEYGGAMMKEFCLSMGIDYKTYKNWLKIDEFREAIERGKETFKTTLTRDLSVSLAEAAKGYEREEVETEYRPNPADPNNPLVSKIKKKVVHHQPNVGAAIFLLTNLDPEHYQNRQRNDVMLKREDEKPMTLEEINAEIERLEKLEK